MNLVCSYFQCEVENCSYFAGCQECQYTLDCSQCLKCVHSSECSEAFKRAFKREWRCWFREFGGIFNDQ